MAEKLGILVSTDQHMEHLVGICQAAHSAGKEVEVFLTNTAPLLTQEEAFTRLEGLCRIRLCNLCFEKLELKKPVPLVADEDFGTQMRNVMMLEECDRYIVL